MYGYIIGFSETNKTLAIKNSTKNANTPQTPTYAKEFETMKYNNKTIFKRKDRLHEWFMRYRKGKQQITIYGKTQQDVIKKYKLALKQDKEQLKLEYNQEQTKQQIQYTLKQWFEKFIELFKIKKVRETTIIKDRRNFEKLKPLHNLKLKDITLIHIQEVLNTIEGKALQRQMYILINSLLAKAKDSELIQKNVMKLVDKPKYKAKEKTALTRLQEKQFIENCKKHKSGNFFLISLYQGLRRGECRALKVNDIDFENNTLTIDESINPNTKITTTKNEQSNRVMPLFKKSKIILQELIKNKKQDELIFKIGINQIDEALKEITKNIKIQHISPHILRHTFITRCQELNIPLYVTQAWVGHERGSVVTTKIYTHLNEEINKKFTEILDNN